MAFGASGASASWTFNEWVGPNSTNNQLLIPKQGDTTKVAIDDIVISVSAATIVRIFFENDAGTRRKVFEIRFIANGDLYRHIALAGSIISVAGEKLVAQVEGEESTYITTVYETTS